MRLHETTEQAIERMRAEQEQFATSADWIVLDVWSTGDRAYPLRVEGINLCCHPMDCRRLFNWRIPMSGVFDPRFDFTRAALHRAPNGTQPAK